MHTYICAFFWKIALILFSNIILYITPISTKEIVIKVHDLPNTNEFAIEDNHYLDLAIKFKEYNFAHILPLWVLEKPKLGGYDEIDDRYYDIPEENLSFLLKEQNLNRSKLESIPFYNKYGGKIIILILTTFIINGIINLWDKYKLKFSNTNLHDD